MVLAVQHALVRASTPLPESSTHRWHSAVAGETRLVTDLGASVAADLVGTLADARAALAAVTTLERSSARPLEIVVFRDTASFLPYADYDALGGFHVRGGDADFIVIDGASRPDPAPLLAHELVHAVVADAIPGAPAWLGEGLAGIFETLETGDGAVTVGAAVPHHLDLLLRTATPDVDWLLTADRRWYTAADPATRERFYAGAWALVHTLALGPEPRRRQWRQLLDLLGDGCPPDDAVDRVLGGDHTALETAVAAHLAAIAATPSLVSATIPTPAAEPVRDTGVADVLVLLGRMLAALDPPRVDAAASRFRSALEVDPDHARAHGGLALVAELEGRPNDAAAGWEHAAELDPDDGWIRYRQGLLQLFGGGSGSAAAATLERSVALDPDYGPAWTALAIAYADRWPPDGAAFHAAETAWRLQPGDPVSIARLLDLYLRADRRDDALELISTAMPCDSPRRRRMVSRVIANDLQRAREAAAGGDPDAAEIRLELADRELDDAAAPGALLVEMGRVRTRVARERARAELDAARSVAAEGRIDDALERIDRVLADPVDQDTAIAAERLRWRLANPDAPLPAHLAEPSFPLTSRGEIERLNDLLEAGDHAAALELLEDLDARVSPADRSWIDVKIAEIRQAMAHNAFAADYNRAVDAANLGDLGLAAAILEDLIDRLPPGEEADQARAMLGRIRARSGPRPQPD